jgi:hypothetical protein
MEGTLERPCDLRREHPLPFIQYCAANAMSDTGFKCPPSPFVKVLRTELQGNLLHIVNHFGLLKLKFM